MTKLRSTFLSLGLTLVASVAFLTPAQASERQPVEASVERVAEIATQASVNAPAAKISFEAPSIKSVSAPVAVEVPVVAPQQATTQVTPKTSTQQKVVPKAAQAIATPAQVPTSGRGAALLASARSQLGQIQDCTAMVERALGSIGITTGDLAPAQFFKFGTVVGSPQPGDILISAGHVGIYAGNGQMISGGFNGNQTVQHPVSYVGGFTAVRV